MFEQAFKNIDDVLWKEAGCTTELDYAEQTSWLLFLKYLDGLEEDKATEAALFRAGGQRPGSGVSRALFGNNFRIRNRRNETAERRPMNFKFFNGVGVFSGLGLDYEYRDGA
mgnify:CR=1 FL=1